jgi:hypothetical protein
VSADIHTSAPRHGATTTNGAVADDRSAIARGVAVQRGRVGAFEHSTGAHPSGAHLLVPTPADAPLSWARDTTAGEQGHPSPRLRQLMGVCGWAAVLGALGFIIGIRGFVADLAGAAPGWYEPTMIIVGMAGIGLTVAAFGAVRRRRLPYALLGAATLVLAYALLVTATAL